MTDKLKLKSSHEVIDTVNVADVDSIFQGKPTDTDILTVVMKDGTRLYCDEVCPVDFLQEEPVSDNLEKEMDNYLPTVFSKDMDGGEPRFTTWFKALRKTAIYFAKWQKEQLMNNTIEVKDVDLEDAKKEELAQKYIGYTFRRHNIDANSKEGQLIYHAYMHGMNQCLELLKAQKRE